MATKYVAQSSAGSNDGSSAANAYSIAQLNAASPYSPAAGDTVILNGTFTTSLAVPTSGSAGNVITYQFATGAKFSKAAWTTVYNSTYAGAAIYINSKNYIVIDGGSNGIIEGTDNGDSGSGKGTDTSTTGIYITGTNVEVKNLTIQNLYIHTYNVDLSIGQYSAQGIFVENASTILIHNNTINNAYIGVFGRALSGTRTANYVYSNTISACSTGVLYALGNSGAYLDDIKIYSNDITMGLNWFDTPNLNHVDGVHCWGTTGGEITNLQVYSNYVHGNPSTHCTGFLFFESTITDPKIYNNLLVGATTSPAEGYIDLSLAGGKTFYACNNTIVGIGSGTGITNYAWTTVTAYVVNNIFRSLSTGSYQQNGTTTYNFSNNNYSSVTTIGNRLGTTYNTLGAWQTAISGDANSFTTDPGLDGSYNITSSSPCYNTGTDTSAYGVSTDRVGTSRPQSSAFDIGSMEVIVGGGAAPTFSSAAINAAGTQLSATWSESCTVGAGGSGGMVVTSSGGAVTLTYASGSPGNPWLYNTSRVILQGETVSALGYTQPGNGIEATDDGVDMATFSGQAVTNNSVIALGKSRQVRRAAAVLCGGGF